MSQKDKKDLTGALILYKLFNLEKLSKIAPKLADFLISIINFLFPGDGE